MRIPAQADAGWCGGAGLASLPASIGGIVIERSFAQKQGQNQVARCFRNRSA